MFNVAAFVIFIQQHVMDLTYCFQQSEVLEQISNTNKKYVDYNQQTVIIFKLFNKDAHSIIQSGVGKQKHPQFKKTKSMNYLSQ